MSVKAGTTVSMMAAAFVLLLNPMVYVSAYTGEQYAKQARVSLKQAQKKALKTVPGKITDQELEKEKGGSGLRYSFDISKGNTVHEVGVDAKTGEILENSMEGANAD